MPPLAPLWRRHCIGGIRNPYPGPIFWNPESTPDLESGIQVVESGIQAVESGIQAVESRIQVVESGIQREESGIQGSEWNPKS